MSGIMRYEFHLFGPRKGQTLSINGHRFVNGVAHLAYSSEAMGSCIKVLSAYGAFARGTHEYNEAVEAEEAANGISDILEASNGGQNDAVRSGVRPSGQKPRSSSAKDWAGGNNSQRTDGPDSDPSGDGHEHAGIPKFPEDKDFQPTEPSSSVNEGIKIAVMKLDPEVDNHWVMTGAHKGLPKLNAVEEAYGRANLNRQDVEAATPGYNRDAAFEAALSASE